MKAKGRRHKKNRQRESIARDTEFAAEAGTLSPWEAMNADAEAEKERGKIDHICGVGAVAVGFSIVSVIMFPYVLGLSGIALGGLSYLQGSRSLGMIAIIVGSFAIVLRLLLLASM
ncbi:hypothetical protein WJ0W_002436 [Paenibacillus melissococcoides]|uniref:DUF4190 domain-containing protein n=1 Tax=Paenibacillus melissococcoides TaxID=2912268 RepID=A0ABN8U2C9_9BACL|nr:MULTISPECIES: hypothetical protein [Paenibacillus]MEB9893082.1 hypothetical protein [Bacillus cereus]CAH8245205.1 hypothetical protein WJ0W_002436 [Paenibacillus melissococcoides]CAH8710283.1 hypothetical protein WDD9_002518 [Paenibacillus melissococcoides]CAH8711052.1 hypothetical protein HTL2_002818 [Paenibacillus melissococcoides]GIO78914.1 hypothetical protein J6TS7_25240 [Paenibacillus dendritiformis]